VVLTEFLSKYSPAVYHRRLLELLLDGVIGFPMPQFRSDFRPVNMRYGSDQFDRYSLIEEMQSKFVPSARTLAPESSRPWRNLQIGTICYP
jgi:hypothetical protein